MNRWGFIGLVLAAMALVGCGGSDNGGGGGGGGGGVTEPSVNTSLFFSGPYPKPGLLEVTYSTGQGRGTATATATLKRLVLEDNAYGSGDNRNIVRTLLNPERILGLDLYTSQAIEVNAPMTGYSTNLNNRLFDSFNLEIQSVNLNGATYSGAGGQSVLNQAFNLNARVFVGRITSVSVFLHDAMFEDDGFGGLNFLDADFESLNYDPNDLEIKGHLSDYLAFDISGIPNSPLMTDGTPATTVYFSGDAIGLSTDPVAANPGAPFEVLVPESPDPGSFLGFSTLAPSFPPNSPNTYTLRTIDPRELPNTSYITALQGTWKWWFDASNSSQSPILNPGNFVFLTLPQSDDGSRQDCVLVALAGGAISEFYFGEVDYSTNSFVAWPIFEVTEGTTNDEISGTLGTYTYRSGIGSPVAADVRGGAFTITGGTAPAEFPTTGKFIVYRL